MTIPLVSVVIATYNLRRFLPQAIDSVLQQSERDLELHVVDDGSTDDSRSLVEAYLSDPRVHYHYQQNSGQASAKNRGLFHARGQFIAFLDGDDYWPLARLKEQLTAFRMHPEVSVVYGQVRAIDANGARVTDSGCESADSQRKSGWITADLFRENFISFGSVLVRRECFDTMGAFDESLSMGIDWDLWLRFSTRYRFLFHPAPALFYREWEGQMSRNWRGRYEHAFRIMRKFERLHPGTLTAREVRRAVAVTYAGRARTRSHVDGDLRGALRDCLLAIASDPAYLPGYKSIGRAFLDSLRGAQRGRSRGG